MDDLYTPEHLKVPTDKILVKIYTKNFEIEGYAHKKHGGYSTRLIDMLNQGKIYYIPLTEAKFTSRTNGKSEVKESNCLIVNVKEIELLDIIEE